MKIALIFVTLLIPMLVAAAPLEVPERTRGEGPHDRLVLRGVTMINGEGAPAVGPMDVLIEGNRIAEIRQLGILLKSYSRKTTVVP